MPRFKKALYSLKRPRYRPSWNKYNLYNMERVRDPLNPGMTYYQQKWHSKATTRTYHATTMREKAWRRIFRPDMRSVVSMNPGSLGRNDGSDFAAGRGSGRDNLNNRHKPVPYMNMIYHQLERRLDVAVWRALFVSSVKQGRQFILHGSVKVNGRKMIYPGYLLNPGDMFQVDVEKVMYATGDRKDYWECRFGRQDRKRGYAIARADKPAVKEVEQKDPTDMLEEPAETPASNVTVEPADETQKVTQSKSQLQNLLSQAKDILDPSFAGHANAAQKRSLRDFGRTIRKHIGSKVPLNTSIREQIMEMASNLDLDTGEHGSEQTALSPSKSSDLEKSIQRPMTRTLQADEERLITAALKRFRENPLDYTKAYKTPWKPRPYMSPFAFIPRYLEVHAPICAAVYLRHPVARAGLAEVPTPYSEKHNGLAFNWYLRRR